MSKKAIFCKKVEKTRKARGAIENTGKNTPFLVEKQRFLTIFRDFRKPHLTFCAKRAFFHFFFFRKNGDVRGPIFGPFSKSPTTAYYDEIFVRGVIFGNFGKKKDRKNHCF